MSTERDLTRVVRSWMREDEHESADRVLDTVLDALDATPQRRAIGWPVRRLFEMNTMLRVGLAAAAVVAAAILGYTYLVAPNVGTSVPGPTSTPEPTQTPARKALPLSGSLDPGTYVISNNEWTLRPFTVTVPAGWETAEGFISKGGPTDSGDVILSSWPVTHIYGDSCAWTDTLIETSSAEALVDAVAAIAGGPEVSTPSEVTFAGGPATRIEIAVPSTFDEAACHSGAQRLWPGPGPDETGGLPLDPGVPLTVWVVDVDGAPMAFVAAQLEDASAADVAELEAVAEGIAFVPED